MSNEMNQHSSSDFQRPLPNATAVLVLGILSIVVCAVCGIVGLILANQDLRLYNNNPGMYTEGSLSNVKAGRVCSIIGVVLLGLGLLYLIFFVWIFSSTAGAFR